jgi:hypothetical protein
MYEGNSCIVHPKLDMKVNLLICSSLKATLYLPDMFCNNSLLASGSDMLKKTRPPLSIVTNTTFSGMILSLIDEGVSTSTGSLERKDAASIKKVTSKNAKSTIGVMSMDGELLGILIFGISLVF